MALLFLDSFDHYDETNFNQKYTTFSQGTGSFLTREELVNTGGRHSSNALYYHIITGAVNNYTTNRLMLIVPASGQTGIIGFAFQTSDISLHSSNTSESNCALCSFRYLNTTQCWLRLNNDGTVSAMRSTTVLGTSSIAISSAVMNHFEVKAFIDTTTGTFEVKINGITALSLTGINTCGQGTEAWNGFSLMSFNIGTNRNLTWIMDDVYVCDGSGSTSNDFLGDIRVDALLPVSDGTTIAFTPSTGTTNSALVDDAWNAIDEDTTYNYSAIAGVTIIDTFNFDDSPVPGEDVVALQLCAMVKKVDSGNATHRGILRSNGTDYPGATQGVPSSYAYVRNVWDRDPFDNGVISEADFNAFEFGYNKSS